MNRINQLQTSLNIIIEEENKLKSILQESRYVFLWEKFELLRISIKYEIAKEKLRIKESK